MIQEQIKLIKTLHDEKLALISQYTQLERKYADLQQEVLLIKGKTENINQ